MSNWTEEIQAPVVLRQTKKYGLLYLNLIFFLLVFEDNFQIRALGGFYSAEQRNAGFLCYEVWGGGGGIFLAYTWRGSFSEFYGDISLFTDPLFSLQSPSNGGDKIYTAGDLLTASLASLPVFSKRKIKQRLRTGYGDMC